MKIFTITFFVADRVLKSYFVNQGSYVLNLGVALGMISTNPELVMVIQSLVTSLMIFLLFRSKSEKWIKYSMVSIILGSLSNLLDRFMYNGVVDYIDLWIFPKFNLADIMVILGILLIIVIELNEYLKNFKSRRIPSW